MKKYLVIASLVLMSNSMFSQNGLTSYPNRVVEEPTYPNRLTVGDESITQLNPDLVKRLNIFKIEYDACQDGNAQLTKSIEQGKKIISGLKKENGLLREAQRKSDQINSKNEALVDTLEGSVKTLTKDNRRLDLKSKALTGLVVVLATSTAVMVMTK